MNLNEESPSGGIFTILMSVFKRLVTLNVERMRQYAMEKVAVLFSVLTIAFLLGGIGLMCLFYATQCVVALFVSAMGNVALGHALAMFVSLSAGVVVYLCRRALVVRPLTRLLSKLFL